MRAHGAGVLAREISVAQTLLRAIDPRAFFAPRVTASRARSTRPGVTAVAPATRASLAFVLVTATLDILAIGIIIPVLPKLVEGFLAGDTARAAMIFGLMSMSWALMQVIFSPVLGALSDAYGRRPVLLLSNLGLGLDYVLMALAPSLAWLFVGRILSGIAAATFSTAAAYIADVTPAEKRAGAFGMIGAAFGIGFVIGPALGGVLGAHDPRLPFWVAAGLSLANALYGFLVLPESLPKDKRAPFKVKSANPIGAFRLLFGPPARRPGAAILFLYHVAHAALPTVFVLYVGYRFGWGPLEVGLTLAIVGISSAIVQALLTQRMVNRLGPQRTLLIGLVAGVFGFAVQGLTVNPLVYLLSIPIFSLWNVVPPAILQILSAEVGAEAQGQLQGANASLSSIASLLGPILFSQSFAWALASAYPSVLAGTPFLIAAALLAAALPLLGTLRPRPA
jgi:DHA1 family tetracycline resistance protein-like MFS transporter